MVADVDAVTSAELKGVFCPNPPPSCALVSYCRGTETKDAPAGVQWLLRPGDQEKAKGGKRFVAESWS